MKRVLTMIHTPTFGGPHTLVEGLARPLGIRGWELLAVLPDGFTTEFSPGAIEWWQEAATIKGFSQLSETDQELVIRLLASDKEEDQRELIKTLGYLQLSL